MKTIKLDDKPLFEAQKIRGDAKLDMSLNTETLDFLIESNAIEGVFDGDSLDQAVWAWKYLITEKRMSLGVVLKTHKILMLHQKLRPDEKGYFRKRPVALYKGGVMIREMKETAVRHLMRVWCDQMNIALKTKFNPSYKEALSKKLHVHYEHVHPFIDGNGRTGRMFMNWYRLQVGLPILVIKNSEKQLYYKWFEK